MQSRSLCAYKIAKELVPKEWDQPALFRKWRGLSDVQKLSVSQSLNHHNIHLATLATTASTFAPLPGPFIGVKDIVGTDLPKMFNLQDEHDRFLDNQLVEMMRGDMNNVADYQ